MAPVRPGSSGLFLIKFKFLHISIILSCSAKGGLLELLFPEPLDV